LKLGALVGVGGGETPYEFKKVFRSYIGLKLCRMSAIFRNSDSNPSLLNL